MLCKVLSWFYTPPNANEPRKASFFRNNYRIDLVEEDDEIVVLRTSDGKTGEVGRINTKYELMDQNALDYVLTLGVKEDKVAEVKKYVRKEFKETCTLTITANGFVYPFSLKITGPIERVVPLDYNYYYFLNSHLEAYEDELIVSTYLSFEDAKKLVEYLENGGNVDEVVKAYALEKPLSFLRRENKLELLKNQIDELLRQLLEEGINRFSSFYIFKVDDAFVVTTNCTTDYYVVRDEKVFRRGKRIDKKTFVKTLKGLLNWQARITPVVAKRLEELKSATNLHANFS